MPPRNGGTHREALTDRFHRRRLRTSRRTQRRFEPADLGDVVSTFYLAREPFPDRLRDRLADLPGARPGNRGVAIPENLAPYVLQEMGIALDAPRGAPRRYPMGAKMALPFIQPWIPEFLTSYQREGIAWILSRHDHCGSFWWSAGSGKTLAALVWILALGARLSIVCTKAAIRPTWKREVGTYTRGVSLFTATGTSPDLPAFRAYLGSALSAKRPVIVVVAYDTLPAWIPALEQIGATSLVFDEIHTVKSHRRWDPIVGPADRVAFTLKDNRAAACMRLSQRIPRRLALTATPIRDRVRDLWAQLDLIHPREWGTFARFADRYCGRVETPYGGFDTKGATNLAELKSRTSVVTHRVAYATANRELPPKRRLVTWIPIPDQDRPIGNVAAELRAAARAGRTALLEARLMEAASRKRKIVLAHARDALEAGLKVVIFTGRRVDCERLAADAQTWIPGPGAPPSVSSIPGLEEAVFSGHGGDSADLREEIRAAYMATPGPAILIGTGEAWGEGLDLQDTDLGIFAMLPYTPGQVIQWEGRWCRLGQKRPVLIRYFIAENTADEHVAQLLLHKLPAVERAADQDEIEGLGRTLIGASEEELIASLTAKIMGSPEV